MYSKNKYTTANKVSTDSLLSQGNQTGTLATSLGGTLPVGIFLFSFLLFKTASAQGSFEMSCRTKAKELAAETYKGCMTDARQTQIEQIRKDYKEKVSELKSHYDKELKKLSSNQETSTEQPSVKAKIENKKNEIKTDYKKSKQRLSGARMPQKKIPTHVIDFSTPNLQSQGGTTGDAPEVRAQVDADTQNQYSEDARYQGDIEIVEVAPQE